MNDIRISLNAGLRLDLFMECLAKDFFVLNVNMNY